MSSSGSSMLKTGWKAKRNFKLAWFAFHYIKWQNQRPYWLRRLNVNYDDWLKGNLKSNCCFVKMKVCKIIFWLYHYSKDLLCDWGSNFLCSFRAMHDNISYRPGKMLPSFYAMTLALLFCSSYCHSGTGYHTFSQSCMMINHIYKTRRISIPTRIILSCSHTKSIRILKSVASALSRRLS